MAEKNDIRNSYIYTCGTGFGWVLTVWVGQVFIDNQT